MLKSVREFSIKFNVKYTNWTRIICNQTERFTGITLQSNKLIYNIE